MTLNVIELFSRIRTKQHPLLDHQVMISMLPARYFGEYECHAGQGYYSLVLGGGGGIRLIVGFQPLMATTPTASWIQWCMQVFFSTGLMLMYMYTKSSWLTPHICHLIQSIHPFSSPNTVYTPLFQPDTVYTPLFQP